MVGTAMNSVRPPWAMRSQTSAASKRGRISHTAPDPQGAGDDVDDAVNMMQRQNFQDPIISGPSPGLDQAGDLGGDVVMGRHHPLGLAGGAAGIEDHGPPRRRHRRQRTRGMVQGLGARAESQAALLGKGRRADRQNPDGPRPPRAWCHPARIPIPAADGKGTRARQCRRRARCPTAGPRTGTPEAPERPPASPASPGAPSRRKDATRAEASRSCR